MNNKLKEFPFFRLSTFNQESVKESKSAKGINCYSYLSYASFMLR